MHRTEYELNIKFGKRSPLDFAFVSWLRIPSFRRLAQPGRGGLESAAKCQVDWILHFTYGLIPLVSRCKGGACSEVRGLALETCDGRILLSFGKNMLELWQLVRTEADGRCIKRIKNALFPHRNFFSSTKKKRPVTLLPKNRDVHCPPAHSAPIQGLPWRASRRESEDCKECELGNICLVC